jgi:capsule biosynthesis phosphatase
LFHSFAPVDGGEGLGLAGTAIGGGASNLGLIRGLRRTPPLRMLWGEKLKRVAAGRALHVDAQASEGKGCGLQAGGNPVIVNDKCLVLDVDGTICQLKRADQSYADVAAIDRVVALIRNYKAQGFHIILSTSRNMRTHGGNVGRLNADTLKTLLAWLDAHDVPYDEIHIGKPWPGKGGFYVDDHAVRPSEFLSMSYEEIIALLAEERMRMNRQNG